MTSVTVALTEMERGHLAHLIAQLVQLLAENESGDSTLARLTPSAYPDDEEASVEFARFTHGELLDRRGRDAAAVLGLLELDHGVIELDEEQVWEWARTLTTLRLLLAESMDAVGRARHAADPRHQIYEWLGYRLELLMQSAP